MAIETRPKELKGNVKVKMSYLANGQNARDWWIMLERH